MYQVPSKGYLSSLLSDVSPQCCSLEAYPLGRRVLLASRVLARVFSMSNCMDSSRPIRRRLFGLVSAWPQPFFFCFCFCFCFFFFFFVFFFLLAVLLLLLFLLFLCCCISFRH